MYRNSYRIPKPDVSILAAIFILLFCLEAAVLNYEHVYKATPDYSVRILTEASRTAMRIRSRLSSMTRP